MRFDVVTGATFLLLVAAQRLGTVWGDVAASVAVFAWVSRLLFNTKARRNMYELETTRALRIVSEPRARPCATRRLAMR